METFLPSYSVRSLINFLVERGLCRSELLVLINTTLEQINDGSYSYTNSAYESLLEFGAQQLHCTNIGFQYGKVFDLNAWGLLGHIVAVSPTLKQAIYYQRRYQCLLGNTGQAYHEEGDGIITTRWLSVPECSTQSIEQVITAWVSFSLQYTLSEDKPISIHFTHHLTTEIDEYLNYFDCPVYFNANFNGIRAKVSSINMPLKAYNEEILNVLCAHAENKLINKRLNASLDMVTEFIINELPHQLPSLSQVATHLGISSRQLQRQLNKERTNLTLLTETIRKNLSVAYLIQTDHKLIYISTMLGYSEQSAFQRAFKRWTGITPQEFRISPIPLKR